MRARSSLRDAFRISEYVKGAPRPTRSLQLASAWYPSPAVLHRARRSHQMSHELQCAYDSACMMEVDE